ncbi:MAG: amidase [Bacteroidota bacterium]
MKLQKNKIIGYSLMALCCFALGGFSHRYLIESDIGREQVQQASRLLGLQFEQAEIDSMLPDLESYRQNFESNRQTDIPNGWSPAMVFNPLPINFKPPEVQSPLNYGPPPPVLLPKNKNELAFLSIRQLAELIRTQQLTSEQLTRFCIDRLQEFDTILHCVITLTAEEAIAKAKQADREIAAGNYKGMLHGIPYGAKDLLATKNHKTTWGAMPYKEQVINQDAEVIKRLEAAGAILTAKLTLGALAWGDVWYGGMTRNPWNPETGSSGSSAGSASAVSAGLLPFAIGTETLGSIVSPSTICGTSGLRPTFGRVSRDGAMALSWSMDKIGPIARSAEDCLIVLDAIQGKDINDPSTLDFPLNYDATEKVQNWRVGYLKTDFDRSYPFHNQDSAALQKLRTLGVELIPIELPELQDLTLILTAEAAAAFDELTRSNRDSLLVRQIRQSWPNTFRAARFIPAVEYLQANRLRTELIRQMEEMLNKHQIDVYLSPSWASSNLVVTNLTGHPCVVLPNGFQEGQPTSITFNGRLFREGKVSQLAKFYQDHTDFHRQHPERFSSNRR